MIVAVYVIVFAVAALVLALHLIGKKQNKNLRDVGIAEIIEDVKPLPAFTPALRTDTVMMQAVSPTQRPF